jgi:hypothetical protein
MFPLLVSLIMSRLLYAIPAAQLPRLSPITSPVVGSPLASNASVLFARTDARGKVMSTVVGSVCGACKDLIKPSAFCCAKMVCWSSSSFSVLAKKSPPVVKSVDRAMARLPTIAYWVGEAGDSAKPAAVIVTDPVPLALMVTV